MIGRRRGGQPTTNYGNVSGGVQGAVRQNSLWEHHYARLTSPVEFAGLINNELDKVVKTDESFASAVMGVVDLAENVLRFASAGGPPLLKVHRDGRLEWIESEGIPLAIVDDAPFDECRIEAQPGESILLFSDGAFEVSDTRGELLGNEGVQRLLQEQGYPDLPLDMSAFEEALLKYSNAIRLEDDLTIVEVRFK